MNKLITATGQYDLVLTDPQTIGAIVFHLAISGGGTFSLIPQYKKSGTTTYQNVPYTSVDGTAYTVGTPITESGVGTYEAQADSGLISLIVSAVAGTLTVTYDCVAGAGGSAGSGGGAGGAVTIADGADVTLGAKADAAVGDATGTVNAHLRQIAKMATGAADNSTDSTNKLPVLAGTANAAAPSWTEGRQVPVSTDLAGNARVIPAATEVHLGQVGGTTTVIKPTAMVSTTPAYTSGDDAGGKLTISNAVRISGGTGVFQALQLFFKSGTAPTGVFLLFDADPSAATITDNTAFAWSTDQAKCIGMIPVISTDLITVGSQIIAKPSFTPFPIKAASGTTLYAAYVLTSTPTFTATTDMLVEVGILQD